MGDRLRLPYGIVKCGVVGKEEGRMADALAHGGDEGRDKLR